MDDINRQIQEARRARALQDAARLEVESTERRAVQEDPPPAAPSGTGRLVLERRQGEWRYYLCDVRIRVGDPIEFHVDPRVGWLRGTFQWGRRNTSAPTIRVPITRPDDPAAVVGEMEVSLPDDAICRWPAP